MANITKILHEAIHKVLNEDSANAKSRNEKNIINAFKKGQKGYNAIKSFAVFTAENPDSQEAPRQINKKANKLLLHYLKNAHYVCIPCKGQWYGLPERSYMVLNIPIETCKIYNGKFQQTSFIYNEVVDGQIHSLYFEKQDNQLPYDKNTNDYVVKDECDTWLDRENEDDGYTIVGHKFKYSIPFSIFEGVNNQINNNIGRILVKENKKDNIKNRDFILEFSSRSQGQSPYLWRKAVYKGLTE